MNSEVWAQIRRLSAIDHLSISEIGRHLRLDRKTVSRALRCEATPPVRSPTAEKPCKLDAFRPYLHGRLTEFPKIKATRLFDEIRRIGYQGGITMLRDHLATLRPSVKEAFLRIETQPGEQAQVDWANCGSIRIGSALRKLSAFVMVLSYSRILYVELTLSQCLEDFLAAHWRAFQFFGGIPRKLVYDNLKSVCLARLGADVRFNPRFLEFSGACLFEPVLCRPARGNEKGKVESGIHYFRVSFMDGRSLTSWPQLRSDLGHWLQGTANVRVHRTTLQRPVDRFEAERPLLQRLPAQEPDMAIPRPVKANSCCRVHFDGNAYTVPFTYAHKLLTLKASTFEVRVFDDAKLLATHARSYERGVVVENPAHFEGLLAAKKAARAAKATDRFLYLAGTSEENKTALQAYLKGLVHADLNLHHHLSQIHDMANLYGRTEVLQAIHQSLLHAAFGAPYLRNIIFQQRLARGLQEPAPLSLASKPHLAEVSVEEQDLALYDDLFGGKEQPDA